MTEIKFTMLDNEGTMSDEVVCTAYAGDQMVYYLYESIRFELEQHQS